MLIKGIPQLFKKHGKLGTVLSILALIVYQFTASIVSNNTITASNDVNSDSHNISSEHNALIVDGANSTSSNEINDSSDAKVPGIVIVDGGKVINNLNFSENKLWHEEKLTNTEDLPLSKYTNVTKRILVWTQPFDPEGLPSPFAPDRPNWFREMGCPVWQCEVVPHDPGRKGLNNSGIPVEDFDAVVIHDPYWNDLKDIPAKRSPHQRYVFWTQEPPSYHSSIKIWDDASNFFNWTMTYRWDSDIVSPYGFFRKGTDIEIRSEKSQLHYNKGNYAKGKSKLAIWICSNSGNISGRKSYVDQLQKYIQIDIYGGCGGNKLSCPRGKACREMMGRDYKFYIAIENSFCLDYVTEKLYFNARYNVIPVVIDLHNNYGRFAPPRSYINALDFPTVKDLANYLKLLDKNDTLYSEYFWWKKHYVAEYDVHPWEANIYEESARGLCGLCSKLHDPSQPISIYKSIRKWWYTDSTCKVIETRNSTENSTWAIRDHTAPSHRVFG